MRKIHIKTMVLGMLQTNCYIVSAPNSKEVVVIDPADNVNKIDQYLNENDLVCKMILLTHGHFDHITAANDLKLLTKAPICAHEDEADFLKDSILISLLIWEKRLWLKPIFYLRMERVSGRRPTLEGDIYTGAYQKEEPAIFLKRKNNF